MEAQITRRKRIKEDKNRIISGKKRSPKKKNVRKPFYKFYKVFKNDTAVIEVSVTDLRPFGDTFLQIKAACCLNRSHCTAFSVPQDEPAFCGFVSRIDAMEYAKAGALKYISELIDEGDAGRERLLLYREAHYDDLNFNLTDRHIRQIEMELNMHSAA
ncbi:MAG TPA: hypothetical protein VHC47_05300 [Mucilaginibacter sp.]|nr:hypothetical protein [Mucilaginibacter sp.]